MIFCYIILYHITLYYILLYNIILYHIMLYYIIIIYYRQSGGMPLLTASWSCNISALTERKDSQVLSRSRLLMS